MKRPIVAWHKGRVLVILRGMLAYEAWSRTAGVVAVVLGVSCASESGSGKTTTSEDTNAGGTSGQGTSSGDGDTTSSTGGEEKTTTSATTGSGGKDGATDDGAGGGSGGLGCSEITEATQAELDAVASCNTGDSCEHSFIGSGCTDSPLPCCGFLNRVGADLSKLRELDASYSGQSCAGNTLACCSCAVPPPADCIDGVCTPQ